MIDFTKPHNWIGLAVVILVTGFVLHQIAARFQAVRPAVVASFGS